MKASEFLKANDKEFKSVRTDADTLRAMMRFAKNQLESYKEFLQESYTHDCHVVEGNCGLDREKIKQSLEKYFTEHDLGNI